MHTIKSILLQIRTSIRTLKVKYSYICQWPENYFPNFILVNFGGGGRCAWIPTPKPGSSLLSLQWHRKPPSDFQQTLRIALLSVPQNMLQHLAKTNRRHSRCISKSQKFQNSNKIQPCNTEKPWCIRVTGVGCGPGLLRTWPGSWVSRFPHP